MPTRKKKQPFVGCLIKELPKESLLAAARTAIQENPANAPQAQLLPRMLVATMVPIAQPQRLMFTTQWWGAKGVDLGVSFLEATSVELRDKILSHMNAWSSDTCNVQFRWSQSQGQVRISREGQGYWSYLGTDILHVPPGKPTMNLQRFTLKTPESEFKKVVRHETGHTMGCPHEHLRKSLIARLDHKKTIAYFRKHYGWDEALTTSNVLTPLSEDNSVMGTPESEEDSIMCYPLPGEITKDGKPIVGGVDITRGDAAFAAKTYPRAAPPPSVREDLEVIVTRPGRYILTPIPENRDIAREDD